MEEKDAGHRKINQAAAKKSRQQMTRAGTKAHAGHSSGMMDEGSSQQTSKYQLSQFHHILGEVTLRASWNNVRVSLNNSQLHSSLGWCTHFLSTSAFLLSSWRSSTFSVITQCGFGLTSPQMVNWLISVGIFLLASMTQALNQFEIHCLQIHMEWVLGG